MSRPIFALVPLVVLLLAGCGGGSSGPYRYAGSWTGTWVDTRDLTKVIPLIVGVDPNHSAAIIVRNSVNEFQAIGKIAGDGDVDTTIQPMPHTLDLEGVHLRGRVYETNTGGHKITGQLTASSPDGTVLFEAVLSATAPTAPPH